MSAFTRYLNDDYEISLQFGVPPCPCCGKIIRDNDKAVQCYKKCKRWFHKDCINLRFSVYMKYEDKMKLRWSCERPECRGNEQSEDEFEEWAAMRNAELVGSDKNRQLPDSLLYPPYLFDQELLSPKEKEKLFATKFNRATVKDKELQPQPKFNNTLTNELVETYNKRFGASERKKKSQGTRMDSIKNFFTRPEKKEPSTKKETSEKKNKKLNLVKYMNEYNDY